MPALYTLREIVLHVVAQVVEAELVVGAVSNVRAVRRAPLLIIKIVNNHAHAQSQRAIERTHPFGVAARQVIVHGDDVNAAPRQRV